MSKFLAFGFYKKYKIDLSIATEQNIKNYSNITNLFTRKLQSGARPIAKNFFWVHPADARLASFGKLKNDQIFQVKSFYYDLKDFLALDYLDQNIKQKYLFKNTFTNAHYLDYYLCPTDYHRVHSPVCGTILATCYVPGSYWPVNTCSRSRVKNLFSKNERLIFYIKTPQGMISLTMVGALCVGKIYNSITNKFAKSKYFGRAGSKPVFVDDINHPVNQGDELGIFYMGSTVICLLEKSCDLKNILNKNQQTQIGGID
ncbi:MAG: phosphatidylserine decarboxylase [Bdellovibrionales bacterium]|nr:phosphatidylserine decarboxylase [Bdellovibrionales bacterium]